MKKTFVIATGKVDSEGDIIIPGAFKDLPKSVPVLNNFNTADRLGIAEVFEEGGIIKATSDLSEDFNGLYPSIGFKVVDSEMQGDIRVVKEIKLFSVGIHVGPNADPNIKPIGEQ